MKFRTIAALAASLSSVMAIGDLGFNLGVKNNDGNCKTTDEFKNDLKKLSGYSKVVKTYSTSDCNTLQNLGPAAEDQGFKILLGIWPTDDAHFEAEKQALRSHLPSISTSTIKTFIVGSEALYRNDLSANSLSSKISDIKNLLKEIKDKNGNSYSSVSVGTVDSWNVLVDGGNEAVIHTADAVYANAFSYWQGQTKQNASYSFFDDIMQALQVIQSTKGSNDIDFYVGETGWPTGGSNYESSKPSVDEASDFWQNAICAIRAWGLNVAVFEAFDEAWKPNEHGNSVETHWGVFSANSQLKYSLDCKF